MDDEAMGAYTTIAELKYDKLGQLKEKKLAPAYNSGGGLETLTYDYNIRGWMLGMNKDYVASTGQSGSKHFGFELGYDKNGNSSGRNFTTGQYNGNITGMIWKSDGDDVRRKYDFNYDPANRLLQGLFEQDDATATWNTTSMNYGIKMGNGTDATTAYDANGNIKRMQQWGLKLNTSEQIDDLRYDYVANSNRLKTVVDVFNQPSTTLGDFRTSANHPQAGTKSLANILTTTDYTYDANGNMVRDYNKDIGNGSNDGIVYNHLNLPAVITVRNNSGGIKGTITYTYDAAGNKLRKTTVETNVSVAPYNGTTVTSTTEYIGGFIYESKHYSTLVVNNDLGYTNKLQFTGHEEGRIRPTYTEGVTADAYVLNGFVYDYMIKDHLGNVRMVLTEEVKPASIYQATIEDGVRTFENQLFDKIDQTEVAKPTTPSPGFDSDGGNGKVIKLFNVSGTDQRIGPGVVLKVMAGDKINAKVQAWYPPSATDNTVYTGAPVLINGLINALSGGLIGAGSKGTLGELSNVSGVLNTPISSFLSDPDRAYTSSKPRAYLNWVLLDEQQFKYVDIDNNSGAVQIHSIGTGEQKKLVQANGGSDITIAKNGYIYVYVSNESQGAVYFDDLRVEHTAGAILEETHYYPFGLTMAGISSKAAGGLKNKKGYNGNELQSNEFSDNSGLELYDFNARTYDQQIGRFIQVDPASEEEGQESLSPYQFGLNNPVRYDDPDGKCPPCIAWRIARGLYLLSKLLPEGSNAPMNIAISIKDATTVIKTIPNNFPITKNQSTDNSNEVQQRKENLQSEIKSLDKSINSLDKNVKEHKEKLKEYKNDPDKFDNKGVLKDASPEIREKIINGRVKELERQVKKNEGELQKAQDKKIEKLSELNKLKL